MLALKDIDGIAPVLGNTPIANSKLWQMPVDQIAPTQLAAYRKKQVMMGQGDQADAAIYYIQRRVLRDCTVKEAITLPLLSYDEPNDDLLTSTELVAGFEKMLRPAPAAVLFGLEMEMTTEEVITLTWKDVRGLKLTNYARLILNSQPRNITIDYVFWRYREASALPLFALEQETLDAFGRLWGELSNGYAKLILIEGSCQLPSTFV